MSLLNPTSWAAKFVSTVTGLFKDNTTRDISATTFRTLTTDLADTVLFAGYNLSRADLIALAGTMKGGQQFTITGRAGGVAVIVWAADAALLRPQALRVDVDVEADTTTLVAGTYDLATDEFVAGSVAISDVTGLTAALAGKVAGKQDILNADLYDALAGDADLLTSTLYKVTNATGGPVYLVAVGPHQARVDSAAQDQSGVLVEGTYDVISNTFTAGQPQSSIRGLVTALAGKADLTGASFTGDVFSSGPRADNDDRLATQGEVRDLVNGLSFKDEVRVFLTAIPGGGTLATAGLPTVQGVTLVAGDRVALSLGTAESGIYIASAGTWTRAADANSKSKIMRATFFVTEGDYAIDDNGNQRRFTATLGASGTLGTTSFTFTDSTGASSYGAGAGLNLTGTTFSVPAGGITDSMLGNRTGDPTLAAPASTGTITQLFGWVMGRIKAITGTTNWYDAPAITLAAVNTALASKRSFNQVNLVNANATLADSTRVAITTTALTAVRTIELPFTGNVPYGEEIIIADAAQVCGTTNYLQIKATDLDTLNGVVEDAGMGTGFRETIKEAGGIRRFVATDDGWICANGALRAINNLSDLADPAAALANLGGVATANRQQFTSNGTWTKPTGAKVVRVIMIGGGGGGGSGARQAAGTATTGGAGGGGGAVVEAWFAAADLTGTVAVTVGDGGAGGAGVSANGNGNAGGGGTNSLFGAYLRAEGGAAGASGKSTTVTGAAGGVGQFSGGAGGGQAVGVAGGNGAVSAGGAGGGGGGAGADTSGTSRNGGTGGYNASRASSGAAGGVAGGAAATAGTGTTSNSSGGGGGGGGAFVAASTGGAGAAGAFPGGGGGGGSAASGAFTSGAGATGGTGVVIVTTFF